MKYKFHRHNPKVVALIIEVALFVVGITVLLILEGVGVNISFWPKVILTGVFLFVFVLTLSLIRFDAMRNIRTGFKDTNLPIYTDDTTLLGHDIIDEIQNEKKH